MKTESNYTLSSIAHIGGKCVVTALNGDEIVNITAENRDLLKNVRGLPVLTEPLITKAELDKHHSDTAKRFENMVFVNNKLLQLNEFDAHEVARALDGLENEVAYLFGKISNLRRYFNSNL